MLPRKGVKTRSTGPSPTTETRSPRRRCARTERPGSRSCDHRVKPPLTTSKVAREPSPESSISARRTRHAPAARDSGAHRAAAAGDHSRSQPRSHSSRDLCSRSEAYAHLRCLAGLEPATSWVRLPSSRGQASARCSATRSKKVDHPSPARSYCSADMRPRCWKRISVRPSPRSVSPPNQSAKRSGSVHSFHTRSRGASKTRVIVIPSLLRGSAILRSLLGRLQALVEAVEASLPEPTVLLEPVDSFLHRRTPQPRGPKLRRAAARDQPRALEHLQVLGDRLDADREWLGQLVHSGLTLREARQDRAPRRIGERRERARELVDCHPLSHPLGLPTV